MKIVKCLIIIASSCKLDHAMKTYFGGGGTGDSKDHTMTTYVGDGSIAPRPGRCTPEVRAPGTHWRLGDFIM
jgi:hypothetical protein